MLEGLKIKEVSFEKLPVKGRVEMRDPRTGRSVVCMVIDEKKRDVKYCVVDSWNREFGLRMMRKWLEKLFAPKDEKGEDAVLDAEGRPIK